MVFGTEELRRSIEAESIQQFQVQMVDRVHNAVLRQEERFQASLAPAVLSRILQDMSSADATVQGSGTQAACRLVSMPNRRHVITAVDVLVSSGIIPKCVKLLRPETNPETLQGAVWILLNIAGINDSAKTGAVVNSGAVKPLIDLLRSPHLGVLEKALWTLINIVGSGSCFRDRVIDKGFILPFVALVETQTDRRILDLAAWAFSNIFRVEHPGVSTSVVRQCLPALARLIVHQDREIVFKATWALFFISRTQEGIQDIVNSGLVTPLVTLGRSTDDNIIVICLRTLANIASGNNSQIQVMIDAKILDYLRNLMRSSNEDILHRATCIIAQITAGTAAQRQAIVQPALIFWLLRIMKFQNEKCMAINWACTAIRNIACQGNKQHLMILYGVGAIPVLCDLLSVTDTETTAIILEGVEAILKEFPKVWQGQPESVVRVIERCGGYDKIEQLQAHEDPRINSRAYNLLDTYFETDLEEAGTLQPVQEMDTSELYHLTVHVEEPEFEEDLW